jgi:hypothetical protein
MSPDANDRSDQTFIAPSDSSGASAPFLQVSHSLRMVGDNAVSRRMTVGASALTIGRVASCDLVLEGRLVSREHCRLAVVQGELFVTDLGSTNGTFVDGHRIAAPTPLQHGAALQVGAHVLTYERRTMHEIEEAAALDRDLQDASAYVQSLLPEPLAAGPVRTEWMFFPSPQLGGCGFGAGFLSADHFAAYMINVMGQGTSAAMQSVALMSLLTRRAMPGIDPANPASVLAGLNESGRAGGRSAHFAIWYGVVDLATGRLGYASAGHAPALLTHPGGETEALGTECPLIGMVPGHRYATRQAAMPGGAVLHLIGDGAWELVAREGIDPAEHFAAALRAAAPPGVPEPLRLFRSVRDAVGAQVSEEDFAALVVRPA